MNRSLRFKLLTKFTSLIHSLTAHMNRRGIPARKGFLAIMSVGMFFLFTLNPFSSRAQFPYDESFRNSTTNKPDVKFGGEPTAFLTALYPIAGSVTDAQGEGYLRLTNNKTKQKGYVYSNNVFLGTYGLNIEFEYFTYGGGTNGADGLSFFLFDAAVSDADFNIGGFGGSLGYAQLNKDGKDYKGVSKGYLGIGLDEFGNFSNHGEGRQGNKDQIPNSIVLRGAGDGFAYVPANYPLLTTVKTSELATDPFNIAGGSRTAKDGDPEYRKVFINLVPRPGGGLLISVSVKHGSVITPVIVKYPYTTPIPAKGLKYGIASSTGDNVNYHEIRGLTLTVDKSVLSQPEAPNPSMIICQGASGSLDILTGATKPNAGGDPNPDNVDLNPLTPEIDRQVVTDAGTFVFDNVNTKLLTFTPKPGFSGSSASIQFTFMDVYGAKSTVGTATFNINSPIIITQPVGATICENSAFTPTVAATGPNLSYQWLVNTGSSWDFVADPDGSLGSKTNTLNISRVPFTYNGYKYRVQVSSPGGCNVLSDIINLTVNQLPTAAISPLKQDVCQDSPDIPVTFSGKYGTGLYTFYYTISDGTVKSAIKTITTTGSNNSITINHPTNVPGVFTYEIVKVSNSTCSNDLITRSKLTIIPNASVGLAPLSGTAIQNVCVGMPMQSIVYQVKDADEATVSFNKINSDITFVYDAVKQTITISGTSSLIGKFPFTVSTIGGCSTATTTGEINVLPNTAISLTSAVKTDQQEVCINNAITQIEYQVINGKNATVVGLPAEMVPVYNAVTGKFTISGTPATAGLITYTITATGDCNPASITGTINVKPDVTIALTSAVKTDQQELCVNTAITQIEYQVTNGKAATITGLPAELTGVYDALTGKFTISGTPATAGLISYSITATGDCKPASITGTINVKPDVTIALTSAVNTDHQELCVNKPITQIEYQVTNGKAATITGLPAELTGVYNAVTGKFTISGTPATAGLITYTITATGDCKLAGITGTINVKPDVTIALTSAVKTDQQELCVNTAITQIEYQVTNGKAATITGLPAELTRVYDALTGKFTISGTPATAGLITYTITATGDCKLVSITGTINVKPDVTIALASAVNTDHQELCVNKPITQIEYQVTNGKAATITGLPAELTGVYNAVTGKFTISGTPATAGLITYRITATGDCKLASITGTINVKPDVTIALTSAVNTDRQELCVNTAITQIEYQVTNGKAATITGLPAELTSAYDALTGKFTISGTPATAGLITYTITATGDCKLAGITGTINVKPDVTIALTSAVNTDRQELCVNKPITQIEYQVTNGKAATITGLPAELISAYDALTGKFTISGTPATAGLITYTITATGDCKLASITGTINVKPDVTIALTSAVKTDQQELCVNTAITQIEYQVTNGKAATITGLPAELTSAYDALTGKFTISGTPATAGLITYTITATGDCKLAGITGTINVKPDVTIALTSAVNTDRQELCVNKPITQIEYQVTNGKAATITGLPAELTGVYSAVTGKFTISGTPATAGLITYTITATGDCKLAGITGTINVKPDVTIALTSTVNTDRQELCVNTAITQIEYQVTNGKAATITGLPAELTSAYDAFTGKFTISGTPATAGLITYTITATGDCKLASITGTINVKPDVTIALTSAVNTDRQELCVNKAITQIEYQVTNGKAATITGLPAELISAYDALTGKFTISGTPATAGLITYTITATGDCKLASITGTINVKPDVTIALASAVKTDQQELCVNTAITQIEYQVTNGKAATITGLPAELAGVYDALTGKFTISGTPATAGLITYTITATGDCKLASITGTINVKPDVTITLTSVVNTDRQELCVNKPITQIEYQVTNGKAATITGLPAELTGVYSAVTGKFTINGTPATAGLITYTITATGDCKLADINGTINVKPDVTIALTSAVNTDRQELCVNTAITQIEYQVTNGKAATITGLPAELTSAYDALTGKFTISGTPATAGLITYTITATGDCKLAIITGTISVKPDVTIALTSAAKTDQQELCVNTAITQIEYQVTNGKAATIAGLPVELTGFYNAVTGKFTINGTPATAGLITYTITATGDCKLAGITGTINVKPDVTIALTSAVKTDQQELCVNTAITQIEYQVTNGKAATIAGLPAELTSAYDALTGKFTISGTPATAGLITYTITATGDCKLAIITGTINVKPDVSLILLSGVKNQSICINTAIEPIVYTVANETAVTVDNLPAGVNWAQAGNKVTISGMPTVSGTLHYKITATGDCQPAIAEGNLTVKPDVSLTLLSGAKNQSICINTAIEPIVYTVANETAVTVDNLPAGVNWAQAGNRITISGTPTVSGTLHYKITATGDCQPAIAEGNLTVKPDVSLTLLSGAKNQSICINTAIEPIIYTVTNETAVTVDNLPAGVNWAQAGNKITISGMPTVSGTLHYKITATGDCQPAIAEGDLTVKPDVLLTLLSGAKNQSICINTAIEPIVYTVTNETAVTVDNLPAGVNWAQAGNKITISGMPTVSGTLHYKITATGDCQPAIAEGDLTVKPDVSLILLSGVKNQSICINTAIEPIVYTVANETAVTVDNLPAGVNWAQAGNKITISGMPTVSGTLHYKITATGDCQPAIVEGDLIVKPDVTITLTSAVNTDRQELCVNKTIVQIEYQTANAKSATITGLPAELTGVYNSVTGKFTITGTPSTAGLITYKITATGDCKTENITGTILVKPNVELVLTTGSNNQSTCINTPISQTTYTISNGTVAVTNLPPGLTQNYASGILTISGTPSQSGTFLYTVTATGDCGTKELHAQIDVYPNAIMELTSAAGSNQPVLCINTPLNPITYKITNATGATISALPAGLISNYDPATKQFTITGTPSISGTFPYTITTTGGCASVTLTGTIKVNPNTTLQLTSASSTANQILCINSNNLQTITYQTTNAIDATVTGLPTGLIWSYNNNQFKINGVPTQSGTFNYTVNTTGLCQTQQLSGTIIITPNPIGFNDVINNLTCTNNSIQYNLQDNVNNTANGGNSVPATFTWTVAPNTNVKGLNNGSGNNINATLINLSHTPQQVIYTVTPTSVTGGCPGNTFTVTVNVPVCSSLTITKTANVTLVSTAGDQIQYTITVKNTGTANHTNVQVTDPFLGGVLRGPAYGDNGNGILEANESWVYTGTYRVTQTDIDENGKPNAKSGKIINTVSLTTAEMSTPLTAVATVDIVTNGSIVLVKTGVISSDFSTIVYTFKITNNGRVKLYNLNLMDTKIGGQLNLGTNELAAGASITVTSAYKVSDEEKRDGRVVNTATVKGYTPSGDPVSDISGTQANNDEPTVHIIADAPQAIDDKAEVQINQTVVINIAGNDIASLNGLNKASIENTQSSNGKVEVHMDGTVTYTPNKGYSGQDEFTYYIYDSKVGAPNRSNRATVTINVIPIGLFIPNTITPNGDGKNDTFKIIGRESFDGIELMVFNRWGNEVYRNNNYLDEWDGSGLTEGTYYYIITLKKAGSKVNKNGWILIKR